jgi:primary-amine oxidase
MPSPRFSTTHPLDPLSPDEITEACAVARTHLTESKQLKAFKFLAAFLKPPAKIEVLAKVGIPLDVDEAVGVPPKRMERTAEVHVIDLVTGYVSILRITCRSSFADMCTSFSSTSPHPSQR